MVSRNRKKRKAISRSRGGTWGGVGGRFDRGTRGGCGVVGLGLAVVGLGLAPARCSLRSELAAGGLRRLLPCACDRTSVRGRRRTKADCAARAIDCLDCLERDDLFTFSTASHGERRPRP